MNLVALKLEIIQKITACDDIELLLKIEKLLANTIKMEVKEPTSVYEKTEKVLILNEWQQARIDKAREQVRNGEFLTAEEAEKDIEEWFIEQDKLYGQ